MTHILRIGDRVAYTRYDMDRLDLGTVVEVHRNGAVVVAWDDGHIDEVTRRGGPRSEPTLGVRWTGKRWTPRSAARHLRLALTGALDHPLDREAHGFKVHPSEKYAVEAS